mmetsp:Transcript_10003/g.29605  ORF Transcript_10003/g.29605 Transcript_10003/m.29605 type:complete len:80 (+) Transcript_10003:2047-2286(+)
MRLQDTEISGHASKETCPKYAMKGQFHTLYHILCRQLWADQGSKLDGDGSGGIDQSGGAILTKKYCQMMPANVSEHATW